MSGFLARRSLRLRPSATRGADPYAGVVANPGGAAPFPGALPGVAFPNISDPERLQPPAQQDADKRAAQDIAERIHLDLGVWFRQHKK